MSESLDDVLEALEEAVERKRFRKFDFFDPYPKQQEFFDMGSAKTERLLMAGNQQGKSEAGAYETACHLTGEYPDWWLGHRFAKAPRAWGCGVSGLAVRDIIQTKLCGKPGVEAEFGTGMIPRENFIEKPSLARGVTDAYDTIQVKHKSGGISTMTFKSYEQGQQKFQGEPVDFIWDDEEPPMDVYSEELARTIATKGIIYTTFTPLQGMSDVVIRFLNEPSKDRGVVTMTIADALHIKPEDRARIIASFPLHERDARSKGVPMLGSGRIFPYADESISEPTLDYVPPHWAKLWAIDFGTDHPFAAVLLLWDKDNDTIHLHHCIRIVDQLPLQHAAAMKAIGIAVPVAWPHDGHERREHGGDLKPYAAIYKSHGLRMMDHHATFPDGTNSTEAGIKLMQERMTTAKFKVGAHLSMWFDEFRMYHRENGLIVKLRDDLLSATRIGVMAIRFAASVPLGSKTAKRRNDGIARDVDFDLG